ncbi:unnamed protein product [Gemmataceae bacterium]|nr:unnamed protein product [Gemmataceae bacterium]VTU00740.1 unnamed protein product [Gemmataceae bacterium]
MVRVCVALLCLTPVAFGQEKRDTDLRADDAVKASLEKAKANYEAAIAKARRELLEALQAREDAARSKGDKKSVDAVKADREAFESSGTLPKSVPVGGYEASVKQAKQSLTTAYAEAIKGYTKARMDDKAAAVEDEMSRFVAGKDTPAAKIDDARRVWKNNVERFEIIDGKNWLCIRTKEKTTTKFTEVARTAEYVELRRTDGMHIRLHATMLYWGGENDNNVARVWKEALDQGVSRGAWAK